MGIIDSNKVSIASKSGSFSCDLTSQAGQNEISFFGKDFNTLHLIVSDIPNGADVKITMYGGILSNFISIPVLSAETKSETFITANEEYLVDVSGLTGIYWLVSQTAESGSATIKWSLSPQPIQYNTEILNISKQLINQKVASSSETINLSSVGNKKTFTLDENFECLAIKVTSITGRAIFVGPSNTLTGPIYAYNDLGEVFNEVTKAGIYYIPLKQIFGSVSIRCQTATQDGSMTFQADYIHKYPVEITQIKPIQNLVSKTMEFTSSSSMTIIGTSELGSIISLFKFYFVSYIIKNNGSAVPREISVTVQPYHVGDFAGKSEEICNSNTYSYQSEWKEVNTSYALRFYIKNTGYQEGDTVTLNVYGVR